MKKRIALLSIAAIVALSYNLHAQKTKKDDQKTIVAGSSLPKVRAYLGTSTYLGGLITKQEFDRYLKQGIKAKDSIGNSYRVESFTFSYGERNLYEDSVGNLMTLTDYVSEFCPGDTVTTAVTNNIYYKTKPGDTAYFENIKVVMPDGGRIVTKGMRFVLTK